MTKCGTPAQLKTGKNWVRSPVVLVLLAVLIFAVAAHLSWQGWGAQQFRGARQSLSRRDFAQARRQIANSLRVWPSDGETLLLASQAARRDGALAEADRFLDAAQQAAAVPEAVILERDLMQLQNGDLAAAEHYLEICRLHPEFEQTPLILEAIIVGSLRAMDLPRARECLNRWEQQRPGPTEQAQLALWSGELEIRAGNVDAGIGHFRRATELAPTSRDARLKLVQVLAHSDPQAASEHLAWLRQAYPADPDVLYQQAVAWRNLGRVDEAAATLEQLLVLSPQHVDGLVLRSRVALDRQQFDEAERYLAQAERLAPERHGVVLAMLDYARLTGQVEKVSHYESRLAEVLQRIQRQVAPQSTEKQPVSSPVAGPAPK